MPSSSWCDQLIRKRAKEIRAEAERTATDWNERRAWWQSSVTQLLDDISEWFRPLIDEKVIEATRKSIELYEEYLGAYPTESLTLAVECQTFDIVPVRTLVPGGFGYVDLVGAAGCAKLMLCPKDDSLDMPERRNTAEWYWVHADDDTKLGHMSEMPFKELYVNLMLFSL